MVQLHCCRGTRFPQLSESTLWAMDVSATTLESPRLESSVGTSREPSTPQAVIGLELEPGPVGRHRCRAFAW